MRFLFLFLSQAALAFIFTQPSEASQMSPIETYKRCYIRMVREVPDSTETRYQDVLAGRKSADVACLELFDLAKFNEKGVLPNRTDAKARRILKTFNDLHISWFQSKSFDAVSPASYFVHDLDEPALYYTRAAFLPNTKFSSIVTHNTGLSGVRQQANYPNEIPIMDAQVVLSYGAAMPYVNQKGLPINFLNPVFNADRSTFTFPPAPTPVPTATPTGTPAPTATPDLQIEQNHRNAVVMIPATDMVQVGELVGVRPAINLVLPGAVPNTTSGEFGIATSKIMARYDANQHMGAGIIGSQVFLLNNANLTTNRFPDEYTFINRRLTSRVFEDILCHQLPTLLDGDVTADVIPNSTHTFQLQTTCMRCHSSIDPLALTMRNLVITASGTATNRQNKGLPITSVTKMPSDPSAKLFVLKPADGQLRYRELVTGDLKSFRVSSLAQVGAALAAEDQNDIYTCAAKRYYKFFTGVDVNLSSRAETPLDRDHQDFVLKLGQRLKSSQSVRTMLGDLFKSNVFQSRNYQTQRDQ